MHLNELAKIMQIVGDKNRLKILCFIFDKKQICVSDIAKNLNMSIATTSHHLRTMSHNGILFPLRDGKRVCYKLPSSPLVTDLKKFICKYK